MGLQAWPHWIPLMWAVRPVPHSKRWECQSQEADGLGSKLLLTRLLETRIHTEEGVQM